MQRRLLLLIAIAALALGLAACSSSNKSSSATTGGAAATTTSDQVVIQNTAFANGGATVKAGATVTVDNKDSITHTVTADNGEFNTGDISGGKTVTFTAPTKPGTYKFHCNVHSFMHGTLTVQ